MATKTLKKADLTAAYESSYYTIAGVGGDPMEWVNGYQELLDKEGIGKVSAWYQTTGADVNAFAGSTDDPFADDLVLLLFPLEGLHVGKLAMFKLRMEDRWMDDVIDNMRRH